MTQLLNVHPSFFEGSLKLSLMQRLIFMMQQDDPSLSEIQCMELIALAQRENGWSKPRLATVNGSPMSDCKALVTTGAFIHAL
jgi:hypothetical protein